MDFRDVDRFKRYDMPRRFWQCHTCLKYQEKTFSDGWGKRICFYCMNGVVDEMEIKVDKDLYVSWLNEELTKVSELEVADIDKRIGELQLMQYELKARLRIAWEKRDEKLGRKGIAEGIKKERDALISDPTFKVDLGGEPRKKKKVKKKKSNLLEDLGIDLDALKKDHKEAKKKEASGEVKPKPKTAMGDMMDSIIAGMDKKKEEVKTESTEPKPMSEALRKMLERKNQ